MIDKSTLRNGKELVDTTKVICPECKGLVAVTSFIKKSLHSMKRFHEKKPKGAFEYDCKTCNDFSPATVKANKAICVKCGNDLQLTPFMVTALKLARSKAIESD